MYELQVNNSEQVWGCTCGAWGSQVNKFEQVKKWGQANWAIGFTGSGHLPVNRMTDRYG